MKQVALSGLFWAELPTRSNFLVSFAFKRKVLFTSINSKHKMYMYYFSCAKFKKNVDGVKKGQIIVSTEF